MGDRHPAHPMVLVDVGRVTVIGHPLVHGTQEVGMLGSRGVACPPIATRLVRRVGLCKISRRGWHGCFTCISDDGAPGRCGRLRGVVED